MNHFQNLGKPFLNNRFSTPSQQQTNPASNIHLRNENTLSSQHFNLAGLQLPHTQDLNNSSQKRIPSYGEYEHIAKKVKRFQENISEVNHEPLTLSNPMRVGMRPEDIQSRLAGQQVSDSFGAFNQNLQRAQNSLSGFPQEGNIFANNPNTMDPSTHILLQQYLNKAKQEQILRETAMPLTLPNESFYPLIANNLALSNLLSNNNQLPVEYLRLLEAQQNAFQQLQLLINNQFLQNLQTSPLNPTLKGTHPLLQNASSPWIPSMQGGSIQNRAPLSSVPPTILNTVNKHVLKSDLNLGLHPGFKKCTSDSSLESAAKNVKIEASNAIQEEKPEKIEEMVPIGQKKSEDLIGEEDLTQASSMKDEKGEFSASIGKELLNAKLLKKNRNLQQKEIYMSALPKKIQDRRKNKWQTMKNEDIPEDEISGGNNIGNGLRTDFYDKSNKKSLNVYRKLRAENFAQIGGDLNESKNFEPLGLGSFSQKSREKGTRGTARKKTMKKNRLNGTNEERLSVWAQSNFENLTGNQHGISIMSSYGKSLDDLVMKEEEQRKLDTRVGEDFQADIVDLELEHGIIEKKPLKLVWSPEIFDQETLDSYFAKLQGLLGCKGINEEKAIKMLGKKNMIQEDVIVTVKKNEKFYSNFLGTSSLNRDVKPKKNSEDAR